MTLWVLTFCYTRGWPQWPHCSCCCRPPNLFNALFSLGVPTVVLLFGIINLRLFWGHEFNTLPMCDKKNKNQTLTRTRTRTRTPKPEKTALTIFLTPFQRIRKSFGQVRVCCQLFSIKQRFDLWRQKGKRKINIRPKRWQTFGTDCNGGNVAILPGNNRRMAEAEAETGRES